MLKVGLIGCGGIGTAHAACYAVMGDLIEVTAVADLDGEKARRTAHRFGAEIYENGMELIENADVDVIDICIPTFLHTEHMIKAMKKGIHIFVEKPLCLTEEEAELLIETERECEVYIQVGQVVRFWDEYEWIKKTVDSGEYGKLKSMVVSRISATPKWSWEDWYNDYRKSGSVALDLHIHDTDFIRYLMGEPEKMTAKAVRDEKGEIQQIFTAYEYGDTVITAEGCWDYPDKFPFRASFRAKFEKATAVYDGNILTVYKENGGRIIPEFGERGIYDDIVYSISDIGPYYKELRYFAECVAGHKQHNRATLEDAAASVKLALKEIQLAGGVIKK